MASSLTDFSQNVQYDVSIWPRNATGNVAGGNVTPYLTGSDAMTLQVAVGSVDTLTSAVFYPQQSSDGATWSNITLPSGATANVTITTANTTGFVYLQPANGTLSQYVRANLILTATAANVTAGFLSMKRYDGAAGYLSTPPSAAT